MDTQESEDWRRFILRYGWRAPLHHLAEVVGKPLDQVERARRVGTCTPLAHPKEFAELFSLWHGRAPEDDEWPVPRRRGDTPDGSYEWLAPEVALLASLVGQVSKPDISEVLTNRLRALTGDRSAVRTPHSVQVRINRIGLQTSDVLGGITVSEAGRQVGSVMTIYQAIANKVLPARSIGNRLVIPHDEWERWKQGRIFPPDGFVALASLKEPLGIRSDKLSEFARAGHIPSAVRCNPFGSRIKSTQFGTWFIDPTVATTLVADRRAGRPMPWHGKPSTDNLRQTYKLWSKRRHPPECTMCQEIWGGKGAPEAFNDYALRYPPIAFGAKRHLTRRWAPGLTLEELAAETGFELHQVRHAITNGTLGVTRVGRSVYVSRTEATGWIGRGCPTGAGEASWVSIETAMKLYLFTASELDAHIAEGTLSSRVGTEGAMRGVTYVPRHQCAQLRARIGFSEAQASAKVGVSVQDLRNLLDDLDWRAADGVPLACVQAAIKRVRSCRGLSIAEAADSVGATEAWVSDRIADGTIKVSRARWSDRIYLSEPMVARLRTAKARPVPVRQLLDPLEWLILGEAALVAGVSITTVRNWSDAGDITHQMANTGQVFGRESVMSKARIYWDGVATSRRRAEPPAWLVAEREGREETSQPSPLSLVARMPGARRTLSIQQPSPPDQTGSDVGEAIRALEALGHIIVEIKCGRYLFDGTSSLTADELVERAQRPRR